MDFYLARNDSLKMLRWARREPGVCLLAPGEKDLGEKSLAIERPSRHDLLRVLGAEPIRAAGVADSGKIELHAGCRAGRSQSALASVTPSPALAPDAFLEVARADAAPLWPDADGDRLFVEAASLALVSCGLDLERRIARGTLTREAAVLRASAFAMELAGTYCRDPLDPANGEIVYGLENLADVSAMASWLDVPRHLHGIDLARISCAYAASSSASAMETFWYHVLCMPPRLGGMHLERPLLNAKLDWPSGVGELVCHGSIRPDFFWPDAGVACEYDGAGHREESAFQEDRNRARDYALCGIDYFPLTVDDSRTLNAVQRALAQIASLLGRREPEAFSRRVRRNLLGEGPLKARRVLMSQLFPVRTQDMAEE